MKRSKEKERTASLEVVTEFKERIGTHDEMKFSTYLFNTSGRLLGKEPVTLANGSAGISIFDNVPVGREKVVVKVGPDVMDTRFLEKYHPAAASPVIMPDQNNTVAIGIPSEIWGCWVKYGYTVTGAVSIDGAGDAFTNPGGNVDIYDVDVHYSFTKLPDLIIERIREAVIDLIIDPIPTSEGLDRFPPWVYTHGNDHPEPFETGTDPLPVYDWDISRKLETLPDRLKFAQRRFENLFSSAYRGDKVIGRMPRGGTGNWLETEVMGGLNISGILNMDTGQFRSFLVDNFRVFRPWLCGCPWIYWIWWPYCRQYSLEYLGTAVLQSDGHFSRVIGFPMCCRKEAPDLWFVVRQNVHPADRGRTRTIYKPYPVHCNTYWSHPSDASVHLEVPGHYKSFPGTLHGQGSGFSKKPVTDGNYMAQAPSIFYMRKTQRAVETKS